jgi:tetratricopeptide (TPR) repeat protein
MEDIATTRAPRVVKLHGSLPSNRPFILTEEDYRTYPHRFAPFVNLVQQALLENELCLIGFSGDDPNFLKWTGWIRDHLGASARRIYLVGALELSTAQRRLLEQRNISPIDLSPLVAHLEVARRHQAATELFLDRLSADRPMAAWDWNPHCARLAATSDYTTAPEQVAAALKSLAEGWTAARLKYPGWAVCPPHLRRELGQDTLHALMNRNALSQMTPQDRARIVFEAAWRLDVGLMPIGGTTWAKPIETSANNPTCWENSGHRAFVLTLLLRKAREDREAAAFQAWAAELEHLASDNPDIQASVVYEKCLWARDGLDFTELGKLVDNVQGSDALWSLRRVALYSELGDFRAAYRHMEKVLVDARDLVSRDRSSLWALSRLAWAQFSARQLRERNEPDTETSDDAITLRLRLHETKCDPWDTFSALDSEIESSLRRLKEATRTIEPRFDAGTYRDHGKTIRIGSPLDLVNYTMDRLSASVGIPLRTRNTIVLSQRMEQAEQLTDYQNDADYLRLLRIIHSDGNEALERNFGRIQVANMSQDRVTFLKNVLSTALDYAMVQLSRREGWGDQFWSRRAAAYTEVLSRFLVRAEPDEALQWFHKGLSFASDERWRWRELFEPLGHLLQRSLSAVPPRNIPEVLADVMAFPLPDETALAEHFGHDWPDSSQWVEDSLLRRPESDQQFARQVDRLLEFVRTGKPETRARAAMWLTRLQTRGALTKDESARFVDALWSRRPSDVEFPSDTNLRSHMFVLLPAPDVLKARELFKQRDHEPSSADYLIAVAGATALQLDGTRYAMFIAREALERLDRFLAWKPQPEPPFDFGQTAVENSLGLRALGAVIADAILPVLTPEDVASDLADRIFKRGQDTVSVIQAYPELVRLFPAEEDRAVKSIIGAMLSRDSDDAWVGFNALYRWLPGAEHRHFAPVPQRLIEITLLATEARREPGLLHALNLTRHLVDRGLLSDSDKDRLANTLGLLLIETSYSAAHGSKATDITSLTLVRATAVRLARSLLASGVCHPDVKTWLSEAPTDPMPEVRFAIETPFE